jgi:hypothetical protein
MAIHHHVLARRRYLVIASIAVVTLTAGGLWLAFASLRPTPPHTIVMATGPEGGVDAELGGRYRKLLASDGIDLRLVPSAGDVENLARLRDPQSGVSAAIVSNGLTNPQQSPDLVSLGTLFYEPLYGKIDAAVMLAPSESPVVRQLLAAEDVDLDTRSTQDNVTDLIARPDRLEDRASRFRLPVAFRPLLYTLRLHISPVRQRLQRS